MSNYCRIAVCHGPVLAKGLCAAHYRRKLKGQYLPSPIKRRDFGFRISITKEYGIWRGMLYRCRNKNSREYPIYGARGITVCKRWMKFENFLEDMGKKPKNKSLDRVNNNRGYMPSNCRWATHSQQMANRRPYKKGSSYVG